MLFHYIVFNEDYIFIYTLWLVPLPFLYCVFVGLVAWRLSLPPLSSDPGFAPGFGYLFFFCMWPECETRVSLASIAYWNCAAYLCS
jgi:hypothetical protein